jgi:hypothetical protein
MCISDERIKLFALPLCLSNDQINTTIFDNEKNKNKEKKSIFFQ